MSNKLIDTLCNYFDKGLNVILEGRHGIGKTSTILAVAEKMGLKEDEVCILYGSTLDPHLDLIGVPVSYDKEGVQHIKLVKFDHLHADTIKLMFIDEYNRAHKKVRNATMELLQFKSINGNKFPNLKAVWAAINPADDAELNFDVEEIDITQLDRFHVQIKLDYLPDKDYFASKYSSDVATKVMEFWNLLGNDLQIKMSPRRIDTALGLYLTSPSFDLSHVMPFDAVPCFKTTFESASIRFRIQDAINAINTLKSKGEDASKEEAQCNILLQRNQSTIYNMFTEYSGDPKDTAYLVALTPYLSEEAIRSIALVSSPKKLQPICEKDSRFANLVAVSGSKLPQIFLNAPSTFDSLHRLLNAVALTQQEDVRYMFKAASSFNSNPSSLRTTLEDYLSGKATGSISVQNRLGAFMTLLNVISCIKHPNANPDSIKYVVEDEKHSHSVALNASSVDSIAKYFEQDSSGNYKTKPSDLTTTDIFVISALLQVLDAFCSQGGYKNILKLDQKVKFNICSQLLNYLLHHKYSMQLETLFPKLYKHVMTTVNKDGLNSPFKLPTSLTEKNNGTNLNRMQL